MRFCLDQLLPPLIHRDFHLLAVVVDAVQDRALIDHEDTQILHHPRQIVYRLQNLRHLLVALDRHCLRPIQSLHLTLAEARIREPLPATAASGRVPPEDVIDAARSGSPPLLLLEPLQIVLLHLAKFLGQLLQLRGELTLNVLDDHHLMRPAPRVIERP